MRSRRPPTSIAASVCLLFACLLGAERAGADPLVTIRGFIVTRFYVAGLDHDLGKVYVTFQQPADVPGAVRSLTVEGPDGFALVFNQARLTLANLNGYQRVPDVPGQPGEVYYMAFTEQPMPDGLYTVTLVDRSGHTTSASREFQDDADTFIEAVQSIDASAFRPFNHQRHVSLTPTLSWDIVDEETLYYSVWVRQGHRLVFKDNIFAWGSEPNKRSVTLPHGILRRGTRYNWNVEICDGNVLDEVNSCAWLPRRYFRTED